MIEGKKVLAVVLARAGSKGVPLKNVRMLSGKPLVIWSLLAALQSKYTDYIVLSSNCSEVKKSYLDFRNEITKEQRSKLFWIQRPNELATDISTNEEVLLHTYNHFNKFLKKDIDYLITLQPTSPVRLSVEIDGEIISLVDACISSCYDLGHDSLLTVSEHTPFFWRINKHRAKYILGEDQCCKRKMRQELKNDDFFYHDCGNLYITEKNVLLNNKCRTGNNPKLVRVSKLESLQIDEEEDFALIENMIKVRGYNSPLGD